MTIVYLITTVGHGKGGHFHSLNTIANAVGVTDEVHVINIGFKPSEVLNEVNYKLSFVGFNGYNFFSTYYKLKKIIKGLNPAAIHAFDVESFAFSRLLCKRKKQASFLNKCGGPNPKRYYPKSDQLILFSAENKTYFQNNLKYKDTALTLIPNRVKRVEVDNDRVRQFYEKHGSAQLSLLRIARIGKHYHKSITQAINLLQWLKANGLEIRLIIIGTIQSDAVYQAIVEDIKSKKLEQHVILETSDLFTYNASGLLDVGDLIIGTGRNFMEASSLNKMLLVPYKDSDYPLLVTRANFKQIFDTNFSPRTQVTDYDSHENLIAIKNHLCTKESDNSITWFNEYFDIEKGVEAYKNLYLKSNTPKKSKHLDTLVNIVYAVKTFVLK